MIRIRLDFSYKQLKKRDLMRIIIYRTKLRRGLFLNQYPVSYTHLTLPTT